MADADSPLPRQNHNARYNVWQHQVTFLIFYSIERANAVPFKEAKRPQMQRMSYVIQPAEPPYTSCLVA